MTIMTITPVATLADWVTFSVLRISPNTRIGDTLEFFIADTLKIVLLLVAVNMLMAAVRRKLPVERMRRLLVSRRWYGGDYAIAAAFGALTPFCSCSSIPLFIGFLTAGIPLGVTSSFLITSPLVNQAAVVLFAGLFGWKITALYVLSALMLGSIGGFVLERLNLDGELADFLRNAHAKKGERAVQAKTTPQESMNVVVHEGWAITKRILPYVLIGIAIGSGIHGFVPEGYFEPFLIADNPFAVPIAALIGVPMYANAVGVIPMMESLVEKGIPLGTAMAFMMAVVGLSLPEAFMLKKVMKIKLLLAFFGITTANIIAIGTLFNYFVE